MKYVITGSTGHISKPLTQQLTKAGHQVTVITSSSSRAEEIRSIGAHAAVGSIEDCDFLTKTFAGADAVYLMIPPKFDVTDWLAHQQQVADNYIAAVQANNTKNVVILSSVGAHLGKGCGPVDGLAYFEQQSKKLSISNVLLLRPGYFFYNLFGQINMIKQAGFVGSTQAADFKMVLAHTSDIANVAAKHLLALDFKGHNNVEYIGSDDSRTWSDISKAFGAAVGKPALPYVELSDEQFRGGLTGAGFSPVISEGYVNMGAALRNGTMLEDYWKSTNKTAGKVKLDDFVKEFAAAYNAS